MGAGPFFFSLLHGKQALTPLACSDYQRDAPTNCTNTLALCISRGINPETGSERPDGSRGLANKAWRTHVHCVFGVAAVRPARLSARDCDTQRCVMTTFEKNSKRTLFIVISFVVGFVSASISLRHRFAVRQRDTRPLAF